MFSQEYLPYNMFLTVRSIRDHGTGMKYYFISLFSVDDDIGDGLYCR